MVLIALCRQMLEAPAKCSACLPVEAGQDSCRSDVACCDDAFAVSALLVPNVTQPSAERCWRQLSQPVYFLA